MLKTWSNTCLVAFSRIPKIEKIIDSGVETRVNSGFQSLHLQSGVSNEQLYAEILKLIDEKRKIVNLYFITSTALEALPDHFRLLLELRFIYKRTYQEISSTHGIPMRTLYRRMDQAEQKFAKELAHMGYNEDFLEKEYSSSMLVKHIHDTIDEEKYLPSFNE